MARNEKTYCLACRTAVHHLMADDDSPQNCSTNEDTKTLSTMKTRVLWIMVGIVVIALIVAAFFAGATFAPASITTNMTRPTNATSHDVTYHTTPPTEFDLVKLVDDDSYDKPSDVFRDNEPGHTTSLSDYNNIRSKRESMPYSEDDDLYDDLYDDGDEDETVGLEPTAMFNRSAFTDAPNKRGHKLDNTKSPAETEQKATKFDFLFPPDSTRYREEPVEELDNPSADLTPSPRSSRVERDVFKIGNDTVLEQWIRRAYDALFGTKKIFPITASGEKSVADELPTRMREHFSRVVEVNGDGNEEVDEEGVYVDGVEEESFDEEGGDDEDSAALPTGRRRHFSRVSRDLTDVDVESAYEGTVDEEGFDEGGSDSLPPGRRGLLSRVKRNLGGDANNGFVRESREKLRTDSSPKLAHRMQVDSSPQLAHQLQTDSRQQLPHRMPTDSSPQLVYRIQTDSVPQQDRKTLVPGNAQLEYFKLHGDPNPKLQYYKPREGANLQLAYKSPEDPVPQPPYKVQTGPIQLTPFLSEPDPRWQLAHKMQEDPRSQVDNEVREDPTSQLDHEMVEDPRPQLDHTAREDPRPHMAYLGMQYDDIQARTADSFEKLLHQLEMGEPEGWLSKEHPGELRGWMPASNPEWLSVNQPDDRSNWLTDDEKSDDTYDQDDWETGDDAGDQINWLSGWPEPAVLQTDASPHATEKTMADARPHALEGKMADSRPDEVEGTVADSRPHAVVRKMADSRPDEEEGTVADNRPHVEEKTMADSRPHAVEGTVADARPHALEGKMAADSRPDEVEGTVADSRPHAVEGTMEDARPHMEERTAESSHPRAMDVVFPADDIGNPMPRNYERFVGRMSEVSLASSNRSVSESDPLQPLEDMINGQLSRGKRGYPLEEVDYPGNYQNPTTYQPASDQISPDSIVWISDEERADGINLTDNQRRDRALIQAMDKMQAESISRVLDQMHADAAARAQDRLQNDAIERAKGLMQADIITRAQDQIEADEFARSQDQLQADDLSQEEYQLKADALVQAADLSFADSMAQAAIQWRADGMVRLANPWQADGIDRVADQMQADAASRAAHLAQVDDILLAPVQTQASSHTQAPAHVQSDVNTQASVHVQADLNTQASVHVQADVNTQASVRVQANANTLAPYQVQADGMAGLADLSEADGIAQLLNLSHSEVNTPAPVQVQAGVITQAPVHLQADVSTPAPVQVQADVSTPAPVQVQADVNTSAPVDVQAYVNTSAPVQVQADGRPQFQNLSQLDGHTQEAESVQAEGTRTGARLPDLSQADGIARLPETDIYAEYGDYQFNNTGEEIVWTIPKKKEDEETSVNHSDGILRQIQVEQLNATGSGSDNGSDKDQAVPSNGITEEFLDGKSDPLGVDKYSSVSDGTSLDMGDENIFWQKKSDSSDKKETLQKQIYFIDKTKRKTKIKDERDMGTFWRGAGSKDSIRQTQADIMRGYMDTSIGPCTDFYQYACGNWLKHHPIPKDKGGYDTFELLRESLDEVLRSILEEPFISENARVSSRDAKWKAKYLYQSCMDYDVLKQLGEKPLLKLLDDFGGWPIITPNWNSTSFNWLTLMAKLRLFNNDILISEWVGPDIKNSDEYIIQFDQTSLGLPTREYFLQSSNTKYLDAYKSHMIDIARLLGATVERATVQANEMIQFETKLASLTSSPEERRNVSELYQRMTVSALRKIVPQLDWYTYLDVVLARPVRVDEQVVVFALRYVQDMIRLVAETPPRILSNYLLWRFVRHRVGNLDDRFQEAKQRFYLTVFGREQSPPRWKTCVAQVNSNMGMALGAMFVEKYFDEDSKNDTLHMTESITQSFRELLGNTSWIDDDTKQIALWKVGAMLLRIGYPDFILDQEELDSRYEDVEITPTNYFENTLNILRHITRIEQDRIGQIVNKTQWNTAPAVVNAYYSRNKNQIIFPAGILQPPFYHRYFPKSLNYGGIGVVIGHEITHGFDDKGRLFDHHGNLQRWWASAAIEGFHMRAQCLIDQYSQYIVSDVNLAVDGVNTQGENIADNGGVKQAYISYHRWLDSQGGVDESLPGINATNDQLFFLNYAQVWCGSTRPETARNKLKTTVHAPGKYRVIGTLSNSMEFAQAYHCPVGSAMNPVHKCSVW